MNFRIIDCLLKLGLDARKPVFGGLRTTKAQTSLRICTVLIGIFIIRFLESIISKLAISKISIFQLFSVAEQAGLNLPSSETPKTGFVASGLINE